jgi:hypothetical protein
MYVLTINGAYVAEYPCQVVITADVDCPMAVPPHTSVPAAGIVTEIEQA